MTITDLKGTLLARQANLTTQLQECRKTVLVIKADLRRARTEADVTSGALQAIERDLADVEAALKAQQAASPAK